MLNTNKHSQYVYDKDAGINPVHFFHHATWFRRVAYDQ